MEQEKNKKNIIQSMEEWKVGGASEETGAGGATCRNRGTQARLQGRVEGRRSHGGIDLIEHTLGLTHKDDATDNGDPGVANEPKSSHDTVDTGDRGGTAATSV